MINRCLFLMAFAILTTADTGVQGVPTGTTTASPQPAYQPQQPSSSFVPHATYPYADAFGTPYDGYLYPVASNQPTGSGYGYMTSLVPAAQGALQVALRLFAKIGLFLMGGVSLLVIGGIFTTAVCSLTPICTISFMGLGDLDKDSMRSFMTPDRIAGAAALVQEAIGRYQRLQRVAGN